MITLYQRIHELSDPRAVSLLEMVLRQAGLSPEPLADDMVKERLRQAFTQPDLAQLQLGPLPKKVASHGELARATLVYLAEEKQGFQAIVEQALSLELQQEQAPLRDSGMLILGALVLLALRTDLDIRKDPDKGWYFHVKVKSLKDAPVNKVLSLLYAKYFG